jgi:type I restriction-modification system DNA methylase subunit
MDLAADTTVLEPSFGDGSFLVSLIERLVELRSGSRRERYVAVMERNLYGVELDKALYHRAIERIEALFGPLPKAHNLHCADYFRVPRLLDDGFDVVIGNPPFGGTFDAAIEDALDKRYGSYRGHKLKKETYSFFVAKAIEELAAGGCRWDGGNDDWA